MAKDELAICVGVEWEGIGWEEAEGAGRGWEGEAVISKTKAR